MCADFLAHGKVLSNMDRNCHFAMCWMGPPHDKVAPAPAVISLHRPALSAAFLPCANKNTQQSHLCRRSWLSLGYCYGLHTTKPLLCVLWPLLCAKAHGKLPDSYSECWGCFVVFIGALGVSCKCVLYFFLNIKIHNSSVCFQKKKSKIKTIDLNLKV